MFENSIAGGVVRPILNTLIMVVAVAALVFAVSRWAAAEPVADRAETVDGARVVVPVLDNDMLDEGALVQGIANESPNWLATIGPDRRSVVVEPTPGFLGEAVIQYLVGTDGESAAVGSIYLDVRSPADRLGNADQLQAGGMVLFKALVLAVLLEVALHRLFDYRWFICFFEGRGFRGPISFAAALLLIGPFGFDLVSQLLTAFTGEVHAPSAVGYAISALIISGGSASVFMIYRRVGLRVPIDDPAEPLVSRRAFGRVDFEVAVAGTPQSARAEIHVDGTFLALFDLRGGRAKVRRQLVEAGMRKFELLVDPGSEAPTVYERSLGIAPMTSATVLFEATYPKP